MNELKCGTVFKYEGEPFVVIHAVHSHMGRGGATSRIKMRNLINGRVLERGYKPGDKIEEADISRRKASFLYTGGDDVYFMDDVSYDQFSFSTDVVGEHVHYLKEGSKVDILFFEDRAVSVELPKKVTLKIASAPGAVKGNTASGNVTKLVTLETGLELGVPMFIREGEDIVVNTETGEYVERVNS